MTACRTFAGRFDDLELDPDRREILITVAVPLSDGGPLLAELARWKDGMRDAPVTITTGLVAKAIGTLMAEIAQEKPRG